MLLHIQQQPPMVLESGILWETLEGWVQGYNSTKRLHNDKINNTYVLRKQCKSNYYIMHVPNSQWKSGFHFGLFIHITLNIDLLTCSVVIIKHTVNFQAMLHTKLFFIPIGSVN